MHNGLKLRKAKVKLRTPHEKSAHPHGGADKGLAISIILCFFENVDMV